MSCLEYRLICGVSLKEAEWRIIRLQSQTGYIHYSPPQFSQLIQFFLSCSTGLITITMIKYVLLWEGRPLALIKTRHMGRLGRLTSWQRACLQQKVLGSICSTVWTRYGGTCLYFQPLGSVTGVQKLKTILVYTANSRPAWSMSDPTIPAGTVTWSNTFTLSESTPFVYKMGSQSCQ